MVRQIQSSCKGACACWPATRRQAPVSDPAANPSQFGRLLRDVRADKCLRAAESGRPRRPAIIALRLFPSCAGGRQMFSTSIAKRCVFGTWKAAAVGAAKRVATVKCSLLPRFATRLLCTGLLPTCPIKCGGANCFSYCKPESIAPSSRQQRA